jgi:CheY-like chemotaxis protein
MSERTILVIDDSATIRRLVDSTLSPVGYNVVLAPSAEEGVSRAREIHPDLIILDHQLPGTTGVDVCRQLLAEESLKNIPVIASSTLRKKAYVEYADCPNVVDMLPKPYTGELLVTTVANTLDTATMVVDSQRDGTAVPEVLQALGETALAGTFQHFSLRAVLDFLNNSTQHGVLEIEDESQRLWVYLRDGRIQAVTASGADAEVLSARLPEALRDLGPVLKLTVAGGSCSQIDGLVQLLDNKVLDPRLLQKLLRHQAAVLLFHAFQKQLKTFRFEPSVEPPALHARLPLDISLVALLVEAGLHAESAEIPTYGSSHTFGRRAIRGQNLDRAGLAAQHQKLMTQMNEPITIADLAGTLNMSVDEARRVLHSLSLADLVEVRVQRTSPKVVMLEVDPQMTLQLRQAAQDPDCPYTLKVVRDRLSLQLWLKRQRPDVLVVALDTEVGQQVAAEFKGTLNDVAWVGIQDSEGDRDDQDTSHVSTRIARPYTIESLWQTLESCLADATASVR